ncbi:MAG: hypothetical protein LBL59_02415 [Xanthomonadaceae bacterium]|jgi:hypothetical protein|nr:hypothetical protein [Xanthomonadaceae bacterium]
MKSVALFASLFIGIAMSPAVQAQLMMLTSCSELDEQARSPGNGFHPPQTAKVKARRAYFHSGPAPRCEDRKAFALRDDYLTAHYRVDGWIYATWSGGEEQRGAWFQQRDLQLIPAHGDAQAHCTIMADDIVGAWAAKEEESHFEEMTFERESGRRVFNSWLHHRPEMVNARWQLEDCRLTIAGGHVGPHFRIVSATARQLGLRAIGDGADAGVQVYERIPE